MPTGIAALIVTLQPILTNALSGPILNEKVTNSSWLAVIVGFIGMVIVINPTNILNYQGIDFIIKIEN